MAIQPGEKLLPLENPRQINPFLPILKFSIGKGITKVKESNIFC